jgi:2-keto-3-deoxy-L-fuconate dehydrogenase
VSDAFEARRVVVTGGSSGIGLATALRFVADGATVVSLDLAAPPDDSLRWFATDVSDDASVRASVAAAVDSWVASMSWSTTPVSAPRGRSKTIRTTSG